MVFTKELQELNQRAQATLAVGNIDATRDLYQQMLALLPPGSSQFQSIIARLNELPPPKMEHPVPEDQPWKKLVGSLGVAGAILWKFKTFALILLTKGKFLFLGLTKMQTVFSMFASMGVYWALYGWRYAVGLVASIYIHEMGHMWAFRRFGIPSSAPMFIPMFGAFIRSEAAIRNPKEDARIGLAGPWWGFGASLFFEGMAQLFDQRWMSAVAHTGAVINLFNLLPVFGLDGSHAYKVLGKRQRGMLLATMLLLWYLSGETMFFLVSLGAGYKLFTKDLPDENDEGIFLQFVALLCAFGLLSVLTAHWDRGLLSGA
ncbi:site-2 protease family protein [Bryobacter aggregatus]|uniref:site-2 protease family protein n=1 Tax=Bryobacter aggregatus TaxID=360054 RepID=UPI0004E0D250|nr:site-2 protease family protein [Bryobacter aggregatus]